MVMSVMIAMMFESDIVIPSSGPFWLPPEGTHLVVLGREVPCPIPITLLLVKASVKWFWVDFMGFLPPSPLGPLPSSSSSTPVRVSGCVLGC